MAKRIEQLLHIVSDMRSFEQGDAARQKQLIPFMPRELSDEELELVAAASQNPTLPDFLKEKP